MAIDPPHGFVNHLTVVTRNLADFKRFEVALFNPFQSR
jgi:predicted nucleic acid-binding protein